MDEPNTIAQPLIDRILQERAIKNGPLYVALDGRSGSGKSTIAAVVAEALVSGRRAVLWRNCPGDRV